MSWLSFTGESSCGTNPSGFFVAETWITEPLLIIEEWEGGGGAFLTGDNFATEVVTALGMAPRFCSFLLFLGSAVQIVEPLFVTEGWSRVCVPGTATQIIQPLLVVEGWLRGEGAFLVGETLGFTREGELIENGTLFFGFSLSTNVVGGRGGWGAFRFWLLIFVLLPICAKVGGGGGGELLGNPMWTPPDKAE